MGMPNINIRFIQQATTAIKRGSQGVVGLIVRSAPPSNNPVTITDESDIVQTWTVATKTAIKQALVGYQTKPQKLIVYFIASTVTGDDLETAYDEALIALSKEKIDYLAVPTAETDSVVGKIVTWTKAQWDEKNYVIAVLPNALGDHESIINFIGDNIAVGDAVYTTEQYTARIAGLLAGTPLTISATYAPLAEVDDIDRLTKEQRDLAVDSGKLLLYFDGSKVKLGRAVTSFVTTTAEKGDAFKKIKLVNAMRLISSDIRQTIEDSYIGKFPNTYDNKVNLINAIRGYLNGLTGIVGDYTIDIDVTANKNYLLSKGIDVSKLSDDEIRKADTGDHVYLIANMVLVDVMEDVDLPIYI